LAKVNGLCEVSQLSSEWQQSQHRSANQNEWTPAAKYVLAHQKAGDGILHYPSYFRSPFYYYVQQTLTDGSSFLPKRLDNRELNANRGFTRVWLIARTSPDDSKGRTNHAGELPWIRSKLQKDLRLQGEQLFRGNGGITLVVQLYTREQMGQRAEP
jgi:hypothetical protein